MQTYTAMRMSLTAGAAFLAIGAWLAAGGGVEAQGRAGRAAIVPPVNAGGQTPTFSSSVDLVSLDVSVRDARGQFVATLEPADFEIYEDGIRQTVETFALMHGGRMFLSTAATAAAATREGVFLPPA